MQGTSATQAIYQNYFESFEKAWPTPEKRLAGAIALASDDLPPPEDQHMSRNYLIARWGDSSEELSKTAMETYNISALLASHVGQTAIILENGTPQDVLSDSDWLANDVTAVLGIVSSGDPLESFRGNLTSRPGPKRLGVAPPFLGFGLRVQMQKIANVEVDMFGSGSQSRPINNDPIAIVYGAVPLHGDIRGYREQRKVVQKGMIVGNELCRTALRRLSRKSSEGQLRESILDLARAA